MFELLGGLLISFAITAALIPKLIPYLRKLKFGQSILDDGPNWHQKKQGTPTMGGIVFILSTVTACVVFIDDIRAWLSIAMALCFGLIGFIDDYIKVIKKRNKGLGAREKALMQVLVSIAYLISLKITGIISTQVFIPFVNANYEFSWLYYPFAIFIIVGCVNSVNLTDGLDGLAAGVTIPVSVFFGAVSIALNALDLGVFASALAGGLMGFLLYNFHPAQIFMGDTGSLFLGGSVCALAFSFNMPVILIIVGFIYVLETLSDIIQITSYKLTRKRVFKMAPIHHHLEMSGWKEEKIVYTFTIITIIMCVLAFAGVIGYYFSL